jgi:putative spermidine/putrescine transport system ATP-binding protein
VRTEAIRVLSVSDSPPPNHMSAEATVLDVQYHGATSRWQVRLDSGEILAATRSSAEDSGSFIEAGKRVRLAWSRDSAVVLDG